MTLDGLATRCTTRIDPDPSRVIAQLFVPGHDVPVGNEARASRVVERILDLDDEQVSVTLRRILDRFGGRHPDLAETFRHHADRIGNRLEPGTELSPDRLLLLGATFTHEYAVEAAAVCNPSAVPAPDQSGVPAGALRFVMSVRQIGEGHRSSIGFRTGVIDADGRVTLDATGPFTVAGATAPSTLDLDSFRALVRGIDDDHEAANWVLDRLDDRFTVDELDTRLAQLEAQRDTRRNVAETVRCFRELAARTYTSEFPETSQLVERVLHPATSNESNGLEDARFVRFVDDDGSVTYYATYTAFDGRDVAQQLLATDDFSTFSSSPMLGAAAANKGLALFPRRVDGRYAALTRHDGASTGIAFSDDIRQWSTPIPLERQTEPWEAVQVGNCGSPIETPDGWIVLTHGVGPMRTYSISAWLLGLDDPTTIISRLRSPLLTPRSDEQDGYVPNVVYSCGAVLHGSTLLIPYGIGDQRIGFATVTTDALLAAFRAAPSDESDTDEP